MAKRIQRRTNFVPRMIFGAGVVAGVVPMCAMACSGSVETAGSTTTTTGGGGSGGHGGMSSGNTGVGGVALTGFGGFGTVAMVGFDAGQDTAADDATGDGSDGTPSDAGNKPDVFGVAQMGFLVAPPGSPSVENAARRKVAGKRARSGRSRG